jgi:hypothetical protein
MNVEPASQANVEYWFRLFYECIHGSCYGSTGPAIFAAWLAHLWLWITIIGYIVSVVALLVLVYCLVRLFELREREHKFYETPVNVPQQEGGAHPRWEHIQSLLDGGAPSQWREAIIEADIMLEDVLEQKGYAGAGVGEKLKSASSAHLHSLQDAWEAHKVRNQIAHQGSTFDLSETVARRTIAHYEAVFRELRAI